MTKPISTSESIKTDRHWVLLDLTTFSMGLVSLRHEQGLGFVRI